MGSGNVVPASRGGDRGRLWSWFRSLELRWQLLVLVLPLSLLPMGLVGAVVGYVATDQAQRGIDRTSADDLAHMAEFTLDLLAAHHRQFQVYKQDKKAMVERDLATLVHFAYNLVEGQHKRRGAGGSGLVVAQAEARSALKSVNLGASGYLYAMTTRGDLVAHVAAEGQNIYDAQDEEGRFFIREMCDRAVAAGPGEVLYIVYPWRNAVLGDPHPRRKVVAYRYFPAWDWIVAAGSYLDETYEDEAVERAALAELKARIQAKKVGKTGYVYAMTTRGTLTIHPFHEGETIWDERDEEGRYFIREIAEQRRGWIRYPWRNEGEPTARTKIVRYEYFEPWDWIVAVGSYEEEFYRESHAIRGRILGTLLALTGVVGLVSIALVLWTSRVLTGPIHRTAAAIQRVRRGRFDERVPVEGGGELEQLASAFNEMAAALRRNQALEQTLAQQGRLASLGTLASGVAHEINNPLGVILGYASHLEAKSEPGSPGHRYAGEIKRESNRCRRIVQELLTYARLPLPERVPTNLNRLLGEIADYATNHPDLRGLEIRLDLDPQLPEAWIDPGQLRQVALNLILNAGAAMGDTGTLDLRTRRGASGDLEVAFEDRGPGIPAADLGRVFEPFYTTKVRGTGLGLAISQHLVEQNRGSIRIDSEPGRGTTVTVTLPGGEG